MRGATTEGGMARRLGIGMTGKGAAIGGMIVVGDCSQLAGGGMIDFKIVEKRRTKNNGDSNFSIIASNGGSKS